MSLLKHTPSSFSAVIVCLLGCFVAGCGGDGPTVIEPTETYELTEQEAENSARAEQMMAEQRQQ